MTLQSPGRGPEGDSLNGPHDEDLGGESAYRIHSSAEIRVILDITVRVQSRNAYAVLAPLTYLARSNLNAQPSNDQSDYDEFYIPVFREAILLLAESMCVAESTWVSCKPREPALITVASFTPPLWDIQQKGDYHIAQPKGGEKPLRRMCHKSLLPCL